MSTTETSAMILNAAEELFARQGFAATTIKQIGAAAGVNPALIYYYFDSKETLYRALLARLFGAIAAEGTRQLGPHPAPDQGVRGVIAAQSETLIGRPTLPRLLAREMVDHEMSHAGEHLAHLSATLFRTLCDLIRAGQEGGIFRADLDPRFAAISVISLLPYFHIARPAVRILLGTGPEGPDEETLRAYGKHAAEFALSALAAR